MDRKEEQTTPAEITYEDFCEDLNTYFNQVVQEGTAFLVTHVIEPPQGSTASAETVKMLFRPREKDEKQETYFLLNHVTFPGFSRKVKAAEKIHVRTVGKSCVVEYVPL